MNAALNQNPKARAFLARLEASLSLRLRLNSTGDTSDIRPEDIQTDLEQLRSYIKDELHLLDQHRAPAQEDETGRAICAHLIEIFGDQTAIRGQGMRKQLCELINLLDRIDPVAAPDDGRTRRLWGRLVPQPQP